MSSGNFDILFHLLFTFRIKDGYWNVVKQTAVDNCDAALCGATWLTNSNEKQWVAVSVDHYDETANKVYFTAARGAAVGDHRTTEQVTTCDIYLLILSVN